VIVLPAIDLRRGRCVRLRQGRAAEETVYGDDPAAVARRWVGEGASWLHVVDLDAALGDAAPAGAGEGGGLPLNLQRLAQIRAAVPGTPIQFGGGLRSLAAMARALDLGATRVVLGTVAVEAPQVVAEALARFGPARIVAGLDARGGYPRLAGHG
jgi:phosphoribosylformimino-5-aminoimidazole carboxamide ribotide isomerase